jgi:hypothetical protein
LRQSFGFRQGLGAGFVGGIWAWAGFYPLAAAGLVVYASSLLLLGVTLRKIGTLTRPKPRALAQVAVSFSLGAAITFLATLYYFQLVILVLITAAPFFAGYEVLKASRLMEFSSAAFRHLARNLFGIFIVTSPLLFIAVFVIVPAINSAFLPIFGWGLGLSILGLIVFARFLTEKR